MKLLELKIHRHRGRDFAISLSEEDGLLAGAVECLQNGDRLPLSDGWDIYETDSRADGMHWYRVIMGAA